MGKLQKDALAAYDRIKATRGEVTFLDAFIAGAEWQKQYICCGPIISDNVIDYFNTFSDE